jgi:hypothetical protein
MSIYSSLQGNSFDVETHKVQVNSPQTFYEIYYKKNYNENPVIQATCEENVAIYIKEITTTYFSFELSFPIDGFVNVSIGKK